MTRLAGSSKLLRAMNESAALAHLLDPGMLTRADLRRLTELSTPTISEALRRLTDAGLITVVGHSSGRPGPNAEIYAANPDAAYAAAISVRDIGVDENTATGPPSVTAAICDLAGTVHGRIRSPLGFRPTDPVTALVDVVAELRAETGLPAERLRHVQLGVPGSYDPHTGTIRHAGPPSFGRAGLVPEIAAALGTTIGVDNDVNLAAVAERRRGAGRKAYGFALLWLGQDGLGLAIDVAGTLIRGARGGAGEIGYLPLSAPDTTLRNLYGGAAILALAARSGLPGRTPAEVVRAAATEPAGGDFLAELAGRIALGLAAVIAVLDPHLVVLAGPIAQAGGETLLTAVRRAAPPESSIAITELDDDAVLLGALDAGLTAVREALIAGIRGS